MSIKFVSLLCEQLLEALRSLERALLVAEGSQTEETVAVLAEACTRGADNVRVLEQVVEERPGIHAVRRLPEILYYCQQYHLAPLRLRMVHPTMQQPANLVLLDAIKAGRNTLTVLPPLAVYQSINKLTSDKSTYTDEVFAYFQTT